MIFYLYLESVSAKHTPAPFAMVKKDFFFGKKKMKYKPYLDFSI